MVLPGPYRTDGDRAPNGLTELERRSVAGAALVDVPRNCPAARETVYPTRLAELLRTLLDEGPPGTPVVLDTEIV